MADIEEATCLGRADRSGGLEETKNQHSFGMLMDQEKTFELKNQIDMEMVLTLSTSSQRQRYDSKY
jgi:hypothetical protein